MLNLRLAHETDMRLIMHWITDELSCRTWAGPGFNFPFTWESFIDDIGFHTIETFVLVTNMDQPIAMGQLMHRDNRLHLARILVHPEHRGKGYGRQLCEKLMKEGSDRHGNNSFSLNVYRFNTVAKKLYDSLGFIISPDQRNAPSPDSIFMIRRH